MKAFLNCLLAIVATLFCLDAYCQVSTAPTGPVTYLQTDLSGNVILATDSSGNRIWDERYLPYGAKRLGAAGGVSGVDSSSQPYGYQDRALDPETSLQYVGARYYDPLTGRFSGMDSAPGASADIYTFNRYGYANGNPYRYTDPSGKVLVDIVFVVYDAYTLAAEGSTIAGWATLGLDTASTFGFGFGAGQAYRLARFTYRATEATKAAEAAAHAAEAAKKVEAAAEAARAGAATTKATAGTLKGLGNIGSHSVVDAGTALGAGQKWLGAGYQEIAPGVFRSADGLRQFRMTNADILGRHGNIGSHVHFEALNDAGKVIENLHLPVTP